jgi:hypothetical protein
MITATAGIAIGPCHLYFKTTTFDDKKVLSVDICRPFVGMQCFWSFEIGLMKLFYCKRPSIKVISQPYS